MDTLKIGLEILRKIKFAIEELTFDNEVPKPKDQEIIDNIFNFMQLKSDQILSELNNNNFYNIVAEYDELSKMMIYQLPKELENLGIMSFEQFYSDEFDHNVNKAEKIANDLKILSVNYKKEKRDRISKYGRDRNTAIQKMLEKEFDNEDYFSLEYMDTEFNDKYDNIAKSISGLKERFNHLGNKRVIPYSLTDFIKIAEELHQITQRKLKHLAEPEDIFIDETMVWVAYKVFVGLDLIEEIDKEEFKEQFKYRNRKLSIKPKSNKMFLVRAIFRLSSFVKDDYKKEWEIRLSNCFGISHTSYLKSRRKSYDKPVDEKDPYNKFDDIENIIRPFDNLLKV